MFVSIPESEWLCKKFHTELRAHCLRVLRHFFLQKYTRVNSF